MDNISRSIRTAAGGVEEARANGIAKISLTNADPGTYSFKITSGDKSSDFSLNITGDDLTDVASAINGANLDITATLEDSNKTLKLVNTLGKDITLGELQIPGINKAQVTPTSFSFKSVDAAETIYQTNKLFMIRSN